MEFKCSEQQRRLQFDLRSAQGKLIASLMAALAEFERDLLRERVRSGIAAARERGVVFGRRPGQRIKADRFAPKVLKLVGEGQSYREISHRLGLMKQCARPAEDPLTGAKPLDGHRVELRFSSVRSCALCVTTVGRFNFADLALRGGVQLSIAANVFECWRRKA
jgi:Resolvase, N terminal domain